jgi:hypothetical protein
VRKHFVCTAFVICALHAHAQDKEMKVLAATISDSLAKEPKRTVAVVDFTDLKGNVTELGRFLAEELSIALVGADKGIDVIDRTHLKALLQEHKLAATGVIDPLTARKLGEIAGVHILITGITPLGDSVRCAVKALDAATARIIGASITQIPRTKTIDQLLTSGISSEMASGDISGGQPNSVQPEGVRDTETKRIGQLDVSLKGCRVVTDGTFCEVMLTNRAQDTKYCLFGGRVVDDEGHVFNPKRWQLAQANVGWLEIACEVLPTAVSVRGGLLFDPGPRAGAQLTFVEIGVGVDRSHVGLAQYRGVTVKH